MGARAAELLMGHRLVGDGPDHVRAGDIHEGGVLHHEDEVGHRRRIDRAPRAWPHDDRDLRHDAGSQHIALEHLGIAAERGDALLYARAAGVVQAHDRRADLHRPVHHLADFLRMRLRERAAEHGEVLAEDKDQPPVDGAVAGDHAVARNALRLHAEIGATVLHEHVVFLEGAFVEQHFKAFTRRQLAAPVLRLDALLPAAEAGPGALGFQHVHYVGHGLRPPCSAPAIAAPRSARRRRVRP